MESQIERILIDIEENQINIPLEEYKKEYDKLGNCYEALEDYIKDDDRLKRLVLEFDMAKEAFDNVMKTKYYKEGFISGVRVALEVSGWKLPK